MIVIIGHYYRYTENATGIMHSIAFFGAALFAFLTGYGITTSFNNKGFGRNPLRWFLRRLMKVFAPFIIINIISLVTVYGKANNPSPMVLRILFGVDDYIQWYIPFISIFYLLFTLAACFRKRKDWLLLYVMLLIYVIFGIAFIDASNWYTSTGALALGVFLADKNKEILRLRSPAILAFVFMLMWIISSFVSKKWADLLMVKDISTIGAGAAFSASFFFIAVFFNKKQLRVAFIDNVLAFIGSISLWIYLVHMKVMHYFMNNPNGKVTLFMLLSILISYLFNIVYKFSEDRINKLIHS